MMMKKLIAGALLGAVMAGSAAPALAETSTNTTVQTVAPVTTNAVVDTTVQTVAPVTTTATTDTTTSATTATTTSAMTDTNTTDATVTTTTDASATVEEDLTSVLPEESVTPGDFFYFLKQWMEELHVAITRDAAERAALLEEQAQTRMAEALQLADAGQTDLAQETMVEAQAKLEAAQKAIAAAVESGKDLTELAEQVEESEAKFAKAVTALLATMPENVQEEMAPLTAELLVQVAATQDAATQDEETAEEAEEAAEEAGLKEEMNGLQPRTILVLKAMADASGKSLAEVYAMYEKNPGLGNIAKALGLKMGPVQHAAQIEWKKFKAGGEVEIPTIDGQTTTDESTTTVTTETEVEVEDEATNEDEDVAEKESKKASKDSKEFPGARGLEKAQKALEQIKGQGKDKDKK